MENSAALSEIDAWLSGSGRPRLSQHLAVLCEERLGCGRRRHLALALLLTAAAVISAAILDRAAQLPHGLAMRAAVILLCLAGAALVRFARPGPWEAFAYGTPLLGQVVLAACAAAAGPADAIDRNILMALMLFAVLCGVPPVPGKVARVLAALWFASFLATLWFVGGPAKTWHHTGALVEGGLALALGAFLSQRRETTRQRDVMQTIRSDLTTAELTRVNTELERLMHTDVLTGVANRRRFERDMQAAWPPADRVAEMSGGIGLLLVDIDHFKAFNDSAGHAEGDACLRAIAGAIAGVVRGGTFSMARWGGEEFVVLAPRIARHEMAGLAERVRDAIEALELPHPARPGHFVTASVGSAWCGAGAACATPDDLLRAADQALYQAKNAGRNRAVGAAIAS